VQQTYPSEAAKSVFDPGCVKTRLKKRRAHWRKSELEADAVRAEFEPVYSRALQRHEEA